MLFINNNKTQLVLSLLVLNCCFFLFGCTNTNAHRTNVEITSEEVAVSSTSQHFSNQRQYEASVWMTVFNGKLYFFPQCGTTAKKTEYDGYLSVFEKGTVRKVFKLTQRGSTVFAGISNQYIYYWDYESMRSAKLYCYDCSSEEETLLYSGTIHVSSATWYDDKETTYIQLCPEYQQPTRFLHVSGATVLGQELESKEYPMGRFVYRVKHEYGDDQEQIVRTSPGGSEEIISLSDGCRRTLIPVEDGIVIHNEGSNEMLYFIDPEGNVKLLFSLPCLFSQSCVTVAGDYVYISVLRYEKYGNIGMTRFEKDMDEGTYRISLNLGTVEKISDAIYDGLYNFDDISIYACDSNCNIYRIGLDGERIEILFQVLFS